MTKGFKIKCGVLPLSCPDCNEGLFFLDENYKIIVCINRNCNTHYRKGNGEL